MELERVKEELMDQSLNSIKVTSGRGFKYTEPVPIYRSSRKRITANFKQIPDSKTGQFHHLDLTLNKQVCKKGEWIDEGRITLSTDEDNNTVTRNSLAKLVELIHAQGEIADVPLKPKSTVLIGGEQELRQLTEAFKGVRGQNSKQILEAIELLADKTPLEISEVMKAAFSPTAIAAKKQQIESLRSLVEKPDVQELDIQRKLSDMPWVFGPEYEKVDVRTAGSAGIPDRRLRRIDGLTDVLEIKLPSAELLRKDSLNRRYIAPDLAQALGQLMGYLEHFYSDYKAQFEDATGEEILQDTYGSYYKPKGILLIGRRRVLGKTKSASGAEPMQLRRMLSYFHWVEVLTYDDLLERAENLIDKMASRSPLEHP